MMRWHLLLLLSSLTIIGAARAQPPAAKPAVLPNAERLRIDRLLRAGRIVPDKEINTGINKTRRVILEGESGERVTALFKPKNGEKEVYGITSYYRREIVAARLSEAFGAGIVPPTVERTIDGEVGSLQLWVGKTVAGAGGAMTPTLRNLVSAGIIRGEQAYERMRAFDFILANADRHENNALEKELGGTTYHIGIDHGISLSPKPPEQMRTPYSIPTRKLSDDTKRFIAGIDLETTARILEGTGIARDATTLALRRIERLKSNPSIIERTTAAESVVDKMYQAAKSNSQKLDQEALGRIDALIDKVYGPAKPSSK